MRLVDLNPRFVGAGGEGVSDSEGNPVPERLGIGVILDCPCGGCGRELFLPFANPLDGGPQHGAQGWQRTGDDFETMTLTPSVQRADKGGCRWHGFIRNGEIVPC